MMTKKKQKQTKKPTFLLKGENHKWRGSLNFVKLGLIIVLCAVGFSVSAQLSSGAQNLQSRIKAKNNLGVDTVWASTSTLHRWYIIKKATVNNVEYAFLIAYNQFNGQGIIQFSSTGTAYENSNLRTYMNDWYSTLPVDLRDIAVVSNITNSNCNSESNYSEPSSAPAGRSLARPTTEFVLFAPSLIEVRDWWNGGKTTPLRAELQNYLAQSATAYGRWWLRTTNASIPSVYKWEVIPGANTISNTAHYNGSICYVGGIWVSLGSNNVSITGTVYGLPNTQGVRIFYTVNNGAQQETLTGPGGGYAISVPQGSNVTITPEDKRPGYLVYPQNYVINNITSAVSNRDFTYIASGFTVNNEDYIAMNGKSYCNTADFTLKTYGSIPSGVSIEWRLDGMVAGYTNPLTIYGLANGFHTVSLTILGETYTTHFSVGPISVLWTPQTNITGTDEQKRKWNIAANWTPAIIPSSCNDVYIPGNLSHYPLLESAARGECRNIYFMYGAELGRPDLLTYQRAFVQLNFDLKQSPQQRLFDSNLVLKSNSTTAERLSYSAAVSAGPMSRERWYMLSSPLLKVVTGDLSFGGFPVTFLRKFGPVIKSNVYYPVGTWTTPYTSMTEPTALSLTDGFAFYMYGYGNPYSNVGCDEYGVYGNMNELLYLPSTRIAQSYGIRQANGILELPAFEDETNLNAHRTQAYDPATRISTFYYVNSDLSHYNWFTGTNESISRETNNGNYRFAPEIPSGNAWYFQPTIHHPVGNLGNGDEFLVGNPYMSSIDMVNFCENNSTSVDPEFKVWNGTVFESYSVNITSGIVTPVSPATSTNMRYIAPLQGFFLRYKTGPVTFNVESISTVRPTGTSFNLRSANETREENLLRIKAENNEAVSYAVIGHRKGAGNGYIRGEDVQKLFSPYDYVPEVYSLAGDIPVDINFINNEGEMTAPLGIKIDKTGEIRLTFTGMDNFPAASKIELIDARENRTINLTGMPIYIYPFNHQETGIQNGRFSLRFEKDLTSLAPVDPDDLKVYGDSKGIYVVSSDSDPVQQVIVYDFLGRKLYESTANARYYPLKNSPGNFPMIVKVATKSRIKTVKVN